MAELIYFPGWIREVNIKLASLTNRTLSARDFNYPWIEVFLVGVAAADAAILALQADGFIIEGLPAWAMKLNGPTLLVEVQP